MIRYIFLLLIDKFFKFCGHTILVLMQIGCKLPTSLIHWYYFYSRWIPETIVPQWLWSMVPRPPPHPPPLPPLPFPPFAPLPQSAPVSVGTSSPLLPLPAPASAVASSPLLPLPVCSVPHPSPSPCPPLSRKLKLVLSSTSPASPIPSLVAGSMFASAGFIAPGHRRRRFPPPM
jgi:hypothetical protein